MKRWLHRFKLPDQKWDSLTFGVIGRHIAVKWEGWARPSDGAGIITTHLYVDDTEADECDISPTGRCTNYWSYGMELYKTRDICASAFRERKLSQIWQALKSVVDACDDMIDRAEKVE